MAKVSGRGMQIFCSLFIVIGLVAAGSGVWMLIKSLRSEQWPVTDGVVLTAEMKSHSGSKGGTTYSAAITYEYRVAGEKYLGEKLAIGSMSSSTSYAQGILSRYPVGKQVVVHYSPADASEAVLETGIHGGTWICFGVGTAFALFGLMFLQISRAAARAELPGAPPSGIHPQPDGSVTMDKPPVLMGVIFLLAGIGLTFVTPNDGIPRWIMWAVGAAFGFAGVLILLQRLENKVYSKIATWFVMIPFMAVFHWVSFGVGDRTGTVSGSFIATHTANVRWPFAIFTILVDVIIVVGLIYKLLSISSLAPYRTKIKLGLVVIVLLIVAVMFWPALKKTSSVRPPAGPPFVSTPIDDAFWIQLNRRRSDRYRKQLQAAPAVLVVRESHYAFNPTNGIGMHYGWLDGRLANLNISFSELVALAYGKDYTHTEFPEAWTHGHWTNCYDVICTVTNQPKETLSAAAKQFLWQEYGLTWHLASRDSDVLVLRAKDLRMLETKATKDFARSESIPEFISSLENYFGRPVINETGATNRYDKSIGEVPARWVNGRSTDLDFNNQFLSTVGMELVTANRPQEWLFLDR